MQSILARLDRINNQISAVNSPNSSYQFKEYTSPSNRSNKFNQIDSGSKFNANYVSANKIIDMNSNRYIGSPKSNFSGNKIDNVIS